MTATSYLSKRMDGAPQSDSGGWEQSAAYARFHLSCIRPTFVEIDALPSGAAHVDQDVSRRIISYHDVAHPQWTIWLV